MQILGKVNTDSDHVDNDPEDPVLDEPAGEEHLRNDTQDRDRRIGVWQRGISPVGHDAAQCGDAADGNRNRDLDLAYRQFPDNQIPPWAPPLNPPDDPEQLNDKEVHLQDRVAVKPGVKEDPRIERDHHEPKGIVPETPPDDEHNICETAEHGDDLDRPRSEHAPKECHEFIHDRFPFRINRRLCSPPSTKTYAGYHET
jgi:hypothetical protein